MVSLIGRKIIAIVTQTGEVFILFSKTLFWLFLGPFKRKFVRRPNIFNQMVFVGIRSLPIVFFVALFTGVVIAMQSAYQLSKLGATIYVAGLVSVSLARELGPVFTALVVTGRVGAAITAELGSMKVTEQIEALDTLALDPVRFLVVPRFLALLVMLPVLTVMSDIFGMIGGFIVGVFSLKINPFLYVSTSFKLLEGKDLLTGFFKSAVFAIIISMVSCYKGLTTSGGAEGVGKSTTTSVVTSFILIILADCILTAIFYFANI